MTDILAILGRRGRLSDQMTDAIGLMLRSLCEHGGWDAREVIGIDRKPRTIKTFPREYVRRLERAVAGGVFARLDVKSIVERIISTPEPIPGQGEQ